jgi:hypothetical protein
LQEPRLGRWATDKKAKNAVFLMPLLTAEPKDDEDDE